MRRKSERTASKKAKSSPEKKVEKVKRTRTRRRKQSTSSENESADESSPVREEEVIEEVEKKPPQTPVKEPSPEEAQDQVWHVKAAESSGDVGEIKKLKICLTRPPSTPERADRSPRSKRKHSRATSSSDTPSEAAEDKKKSKHRSKRTRESKDDSEKNQDSQEEAEAESETQKVAEKSDSEVTQEAEKQEQAVSDETPMSTTNEEESKDEAEQQESSSQDSTQKEVTTETATEDKASDADTTVASPTVETTAASPKPEETVDSSKSDDDKPEPAKDSPEVQRGESVEKSEVLELHAEEEKNDSLDTSTSEAKNESKEDSVDGSQESSKEVSSEDKCESVSQETSVQSENKATNETDVVESSQTVDKEGAGTTSPEPVKDKSMEVSETTKTKELDRSDSVQSSQSNNEDTVPNGQASAIVISRKRRWGSRPSKVATQKSITISTDVLKEIIPDVKPVEFEEVIEEKKHKRVEVSERLERPVLPKIVIDNTENVEQHRNEEREKENIKARETHLASNRKISIVKENDVVVARPPSPPRHKQSCILYITNLVRPFTLQQLKNLLQRTGKIVENGFWIDRIKSKCFVKYENEDQAVETRHALHGVTWPVSNPKTLQVDFSTEDAFDKAKLNEDTDNAKASTIPGTVEDWLREQDMKKERGEVEKPWERKAAMREWDVGKNEKEKDNKEKLRRDERPLDKRRHRSQERSPEPAKKFKKKEEEAPAKLLDDLFRKTKTTPCIYWLPLSAETIAIKEEQRRQHMAEHERRLQELRRTHRRH